MDGHQVRQRGDGANLALRVPVEHDLNLDAKNTLQEHINIRSEKPPNKLTSKNKLYDKTIHKQQTANTNLSEKDMSDSSVNVLVHRLTRRDHVAILELHGLGSLGPELTTHNNLHENAYNFCDAEHQRNGSIS